MARKSVLKSGNGGRVPPGSEKFSAKGNPIGNPIRIIRKSEFFRVPGYTSTKKGPGTTTTITDTRKMANRKPTKRRIFRRNYRRKTEHPIYSFSVSGQRKKNALALCKPEIEN